jgi:hypothetical protein
MAQRSKSGGRQKGTPNRATAEVRNLALEYGPAAVKELARLAENAQSEDARVQACNAIIERAYGKALPSRPIVLRPALPEERRCVVIRYRQPRPLGATRASKIDGNRWRKAQNPADGRRAP